MLILERIFDSLLFLSKKEIYKERKFSFLSYQNRRFWGKDKKIAQIFDSLHLYSYSEFRRNFTRIQEQANAAEIIL